MALSRRRFVAFGGLLTAFVLGSSATAQPPKTYRVGFLAAVVPLSELSGSAPSNSAARAFVDELRSLGFAEGRNLILDMRTLEGRFERLESTVADIVRLKADVIFFPGDSVARPAAKVTGTTPVVTLFGGNVLNTGLVQSLARPGGTVTGLVVDIDSAVEAKRLEMLLEMFPRARRIAFLGPQEQWDGAVTRHVIASAERLGLQLYHVRADASDYGPAFSAISRDRPDAVYVPTGPISYGKRREIGRFLAAQRIPSSCSQSELVEEGCLMSYGVDIDTVMRQAAGYVAKILKGARPADLPIEQPTRLVLVVNRASANAIGRSIPESIRVRANRVVD